MSSNDKLRVKLSSAIDPSDTHAIDIKYHGKCWVNHVTSVLRRGKSQAPAVSTDQLVSHRASKAAAQIEFLTMVENTLRNGTRRKKREEANSHNRKIRQPVHRRK